VGFLFLPVNNAPLPGCPNSIRNGKPGNTLLKKISNKHQPYGRNNKAFSYLLIYGYRKCTVETLIMVIVVAKKSGTIFLDYP